MKYYNDILIPDIIRCDRICSAFQNPVDENKVNEYSLIMSENYTSHDFPPILGFPRLIENEEELEDAFMNMININSHIEIGDIIWMVTDGHHRSAAAIKAQLPHLAVELDYSCITTEEDLKQYK